MILISEKKIVHIKEYPYAQKLNPVLHQIIKIKASQMDKGALMTNWNCVDIPEFKLISDYVYNFLISSARTLYNPTLRPLDGYPLLLHNLWGQMYNKGHFQESHWHLPYHWSFVYYVNTPRGSSPLVFTQSRKRIRVKEGNFVIFPAGVEHYVPRNKCDERSAVAGNFYYKINDAV